MQSPFVRQPLPDLPVVLKPLVYCEFRVAESQGEWNQANDVTMCPVFASEVIEEMPFCFMHGQIIQQALEAEGGGHVS